MSPTFRSLHNRNYRLYAMGGVVSNTGTWMQRVAQDWLVLQLHHGSAASASTALGITTGLQFLPILLLSPYAGLVADRFSKRRLLQLTQAWLGLSGLLLGVLAVTGVVEPWMVYAVAFTFGIGAAFDAPARQSFVSEMVDRDDLSNAVGLNSASFNLARVVGPALSGFLIAALGSGVRATGLVILVNAVSYLAVIGALQLMRTDELAPVVRAPRGKGMIRDGIRYVRSRPDLKLILVAVFFAGTFGMNFQMTSALMATQVFEKGPGEYGLLGTTLAIGSLTGALLGARRVGRPRLRLVILAGLAFGIVEIALGLMPSYVAFAALTPAAGPVPAHDAQRREHDGAAERRPVDAGARDGALHDAGDGRHPAGCADRRLGGRHVRCPVDPDRRRRDVRDRRLRGGAGLRWCHPRPAALARSPRRDRGHHRRGDGRLAPP